MSTIHPQRKHELQKTTSTALTPEIHFKHNDDRKLAY